MADWRDVMDARSRADTARATLDRYGEHHEERENDPAVMATLLAALALTAELRALGTVIDYTAREHAPLSPL